MTNRVVYGALPGGGYGIRVSRPGNDVLNTALTGKQLAFDSRWTSSARVFLNGSVVIGVGGIGTFYTVSFGTTFASIPPVIILFRQTSSAAWRVADGAAFNESWLPSGGVYELTRVFTNRLELSYPTTGGNREYAYLVMRPI